MNFLSKIFGDPNARAIRELTPVVEKINSLEKEYEKLSDEDLSKKTEELKKHADLDEILPEAFALVREAAKRTLNQRHFDVQLLGGMTLHHGQIAEMKTGEGKTLVATLPAYLNALSGRGVHIVTVNDYLARRDTAWMGQIFNALGLSVACIVHDTAYIYDPQYANKNLDKERDVLGGFKIVHEFLRPCTRREAYAADVTYGTNNEFGFDYLRDNMAYSLEDMVQRGHHFAIVDEVDSILIDEARTPLIISTPDTESGDLYRIFSKIIPKLKNAIDYTIDEKMKTATITEAGIEKAESLLGVSDIYTEKGIRYVHHLEQALRAETLFTRDRDYVVKSGEVIIVDEFTGRLMPGRRWSEGLHQAVEAKEGVEVQKESRTLATITFQNYFRLYKKLSGMTGTAATSAEEFHTVYKLEVMQIPPNRPMIRKDLSDKIFQNEKGKWAQLVKEIKERNKKGQPVLVGTVSIEKNERLAALLNREGIPHKILNAKNHEEEAAITAQAGKFGAVTVATNMAGRGVDIILGGNPPDEGQASRVKSAGGLLVIGTERHEARRIDNQLRGRSGRQGDSGESQFYVSLEDDLMRIFGSDKIKNLMVRMGIPEDEPIENKMVSHAIESAQEKIEGFNFDTRKHVLEYDDVMNKQRTAIYSERIKILSASPEEIEHEALRIGAEVVSKIVETHTISDATDDWNRAEIEENIKTMVGDFVFENKSLHEIILSSHTKEDLIRILNNYITAVFSEKKAGVKDFLHHAHLTMLQAIDLLWMEHIEAMDYMRSSVRLRAYGQRDPLIEYKNEGAKMFHALQGSINAYIANMVWKIGEHSHTQQKSNVNVKHPMSDNKNIGRNDLCWCGSGKKFKKCHGK